MFNLDKKIIVCLIKHHLFILDKKIIMCLINNNLQNTKIMFVCIFKIIIFRKLKII
jgi:hypothetical protein